MNDKDFANSVSQDKLARCLSAFARLCAESPGKASKLEYLLIYFPIVYWSGVAIAKIALN
jgi:hypothetical protein